MRATARAPGVVVTFASAAVFGALAVSLLAFARLPRRGFSLSERGFPRDLSVASASAIVDEARGTAWIVGSRQVCAIDLARGGATGCHPLDAVREPPRHIAAAGTLLVVHDDARAAEDAVAFSFELFSAEGELVRSGRVGDDLPDSFRAGSAMTNVAWDAAKHRFEVNFFHEDESGRVLVEVPIDRRFGPLETSSQRVVTDLAKVRATFPADPRRVLFDDRTLHDGAHVVKLPLPDGACVGAASVDCLAIQGEARAADAGAIAVFVGADGRVAPATEMPGSDAYLPILRQRVIEIAGEGLATPRLTGANAMRLVVPLADLSHATFEVREGAGERVLFGRIGDGVWQRLARGASPIAAWTVLPFRGGALAIDDVARRGLVLNSDLTPRDPAPRALASIGEIAGDRWSTADLDVKLFALALLMFPPLFALALTAELRRGRGLSGTHRAAFALALWGVCVAAFLLIRRGALFPP